MYYTIHHLTQYRYSEPITENVMEVRKQPLSDAIQTCLSFSLTTLPQAEIHDYVDGWQNRVHHFSIVRPHKRLEIVSQALVQVGEQPHPAPGEATLALWPALQTEGRSLAMWDYLRPSHYVQFTPAMRTFAAEFHATTHEVDPFTLLSHIQEAIYTRFEYEQDATRFDSPAEHVLETGAGVCQDFTHLMIGVARLAGIPARYVSGYLFHREGAHDRSTDDASHAWVEAWLPGWGWVGFDPTNNLVVKRRHIRVAIGRDYADVTPTRGVFTGQATSSLKVAVKVLAAEAPPTHLPAPTPSTWAMAEDEGESDATAVLLQQQQQQQQ